MSAHATTTHNLGLPNTTKKLNVEVSLVPSEEVSESDKKNTNVARIQLGGKEFFAVVGKTNVTD